jgi:hypothetical protein
LRKAGGEEVVELGMCVFTDMNMCKNEAISKKLLSPKMCSQVK